MINREAQVNIDEINSTFRVLLVTGPRQVGKTTLLKSVLPQDMNYVTLDDEALRKQAKENPALFLEEHPWPLLIDEVQYAPELFPYIKIKVDEEGKRGMYWLTGSQQFYLMKNVSESLAGRVGIVRLNSLTYAELLGNEKRELFNPGNYKKTSPIDVNKLFEVIYKGGMPELNDIKGMKERNFFDAYVETYISRDVVGILDIKDKELFKKFMINIACRCGEQINYNSIAKEMQITDKTVKEWLNILVTSGIVYLLEPFRSTKLDRLTHIPKIIFMDTGLCAYLAGWTSARDLQLSDVSGHYLESYIISDIIKSYNARNEYLNISYYRDKEKNEIDLIIEKNNTLYPFEIKKTASPNSVMIKNFQKLDSHTKKIGAGGIICFYKELMHIDENNYIIPVSSVLNLPKGK